MTHITRIFSVRVAVFDAWKHRWNIRQKPEIASQSLFLYLYRKSHFFACLRLLSCSAMSWVDSQALIYFAVSKKGEAPIDGITDENPEGLTSTSGKWAEEFKARLAGGGLTCHVLPESRRAEQYRPPIRLPFVTATDIYIYIYMTLSCALSNWTILNLAHPSPSDDDYGYLYPFSTNKKSK